MTDRALKCWLKTTALLVFVNGNDVLFILQEIFHHKWSLEMHVKTHSIASEDLIFLKLSISDQIRGDSY